MRRKTGYIYEAQDWPRFQWVPERLASPLVDVRHRQGRLIGRMEGLGFQLRAEAALQTLTEEVIKSSEIEGEILDREAKRLEQGDSVVVCAAGRSAYQDGAEFGADMAGSDRTVPYRQQVLTALGLCLRP